MLNTIIQSQNMVVEKYIGLYPDLCNFISHSIEILDHVDLPEEVWNSIPESHRSVFNLFHLDGLSTMISAVRLVLHGCETDAYALMRVVMENMTIFKYIVQDSLYAEAFEELKNKSAKGKNFSKKFSFQKSADSLKEPNLSQEPRNQLFGLLSGIGSHISPARLAKSRFSTKDVKVGFMLNNLDVKLALGMLADLMLFFVSITTDFIVTETKQYQHPLRSSLKQLQNEYSSLNSAVT